MFEFTNTWFELVDTPLNETCISLNHVAPVAVNPFTTRFAPVTAAPAGIETLPLRTTVP